MRRNILATALISCALVLVPTAANATTQPDEQVTEWYSWVTSPIEGVTDPKNDADVTWPQSLAGFGELNPPCGVWYQLDKYVGTRTAIDAVVGDEILTRIDGLPEDRGIVKDWVFVYGGDCAPKPPAEHASEPNSSFACDFVTYTTQEWDWVYPDDSFDPVANVWDVTKRVKENVKSTSEQIPTTYDERAARGCEPELAETGVNDNAWLFAGGGLLLLVAGASLVAYRKRKEAK